MTTKRPRATIGLEPELAELWQRTVEFGKRELQDPELRRRDREGSFWRTGWDRCGRYGAHGLPVPAGHGGLGLTMLGTMVVFDALGYACPDAGLLFSINAHLWSSVVPLWLHGTAAQRERWLGPLIRGEIVGNHAMTEPGSGSDAFALTTKVRHEGDTLVLNGSKTFITNAPIADLLIIFAREEGSVGSEGLSAVVVEAGTPGLIVGKPFDKMGLRTSPMADVTLDDCRVPVENRVGQPGAGSTVFNSSMLWERSCITAPLVGAMQRQMESCIAYARERRQFDRSIGSFVAVAEKIANMKVRIDTSRALLRNTGAAIDSGQGGLLEASVSKLYVSESAVAVHRDAIQIYGGYGYMTETEVERDLRNALGSTIYSGTSEMQRHIIGRLLGL